MITEEQLTLLTRRLATSPKEDFIAEEFPEVMQIWRTAVEKVRQEDDLWLDELVQYLWDQAADAVANSWKGSEKRAAQGLFLWAEYTLRPLLELRCPQPDLNDLQGYWEQLDAPEKQLFQQRYRIPPDSWKDIRSGRTVAYEQMKKGRALLARWLVRPLREEQVIEPDRTQYAVAQRKWLEQLPDGSRWVGDYVPPRLREAGPPEILHTPESALTAALEQGIGVLAGGSGWGKSVLLRWMGLQLLEQGWTVAWLDTDVDADALSPALLAERWCAQLGLAGREAKALAQRALNGRRWALLVDGGEQWRNRQQREALVAWVRQQDGVLLVASRPTETPWSATAWVAQVEWTAALLRRILERTRNAALVVQLEAWLQSGDLIARPWEYSLAARLTQSLDVITPLQLLGAALDEQWRELSANGLDPRVAGKQRRSLEGQAWRTFTLEQAAWQTLKPDVTSATKTGVAMRLVETLPANHYRFVHSLWQQFLAARHAVTLEPEAVVEAALGVEDGATVIGWAGLLALQSGAMTWTMQLAEILSTELARAPQGSGWLLEGAAVVGGWLRHPGFADTPAGQTLRQRAETGVWQAWESLSELDGLSWRGAAALTRAWTALAPWSQSTVSRLWQQTLSVSEWHSHLIEAALAQPQVAEKWARGLHAGQAVPDWVWRAVGRSRQFTAAALVQKVGLVYPGANNQDSYARVRAGTMALARLGTVDAGRQLPRWLAEEAHAYPDRAPRWEDSVRDELQEWTGNTADLWIGVPWLLTHAATEAAAFWQGYLRGACAATGAEGAQTLAQLAEREGQQWSLKVWEEACRLWRRHGDERIIPLLTQLWQILEQSKANAGSPADGEENTVRQLYLEIALWGSEKHSGLLGQQPTAWIVRWLETTCPVALRYNVTVTILQWRHDAAVARLGNTWWQKGQKTQNRSLQQLALYLLPPIQPAVLQVYLEDADYHGTALIAAARMGYWDLVLPYGAGLLQQQQYLGEVHGRALQAAVSDWLPLVLAAVLDAGHSELLLYGWGHHPSGEVDAVLDRMLARTTIALQDLAERVWALGTPGAVRQVLAWVQNGAAEFPQQSLPQPYREEIWSSLVVFLQQAGSEQDLARWKAFGQLTRLWPLRTPRPWAVTEFLFTCLEDWDEDIRAQTAEIVLGNALRLSRGQIWIGAEEEYATGLHRWVLEGTVTQRRVALEWLTEMDGPAGNALSTSEVTALLTSLPYAALKYIVAHHRKEQETAIKERLTGWRAADEALFSEAVNALGLLGVGANTVLALGLNEPEQAHPWSNPAMASLLRQPAYLETLLTAVLRNWVPVSWWVTALVENGLLAEENEGTGWMLRHGTRRIPVGEWVTRKR